MNISRRKFLVAAPVVAGAVLQFQGIAFGQISDKIRLPPVGIDALSKLTWDSFYQFINTDFTFGHGGNAVSLRLTAMTDSIPFTVKRRKGQECFVMKFQGPFNPPLRQETYQVNHFALGDFDLFITDGGRVKRGQFYIAIINRIVQ